MDIHTYTLFFREIAKRRRFIIRTVAIATVVMTVYVFIMPQTYTSTVTMMPPQQEQSRMGLSSLLQGAGASIPMMDITSTFGFGSRPADLFVQVLKSRTVAESLIVHQDLDAFFGVPEGDSYRFAIEPLTEATAVEATKDGIISVSVEFSTGYFPSGKEIDSIRNFTARIANDYVYWLDVVNREKMVSKARNSRKFIEAEIGRVQADLDSSYDQLVRYQEKNKSIFLDKQMEAALGAATQVRIQLQKAQIELQVKKQDFSEDSRILSNLRKEIDELQSMYDALQEGEGMKESEFYVPFSKLPTAARELADHLRTIKVLEVVVAFMTQKYYEDRVQEAKDTPTVQVLDTAIPAIQRSSPKRSLWILMTIFFATVGAAVYAGMGTVLETRKKNAARSAGASDTVKSKADNTG